MKRNMPKTDTYGTLSLEACVSVTLFVLFVLFLSSFLWFFMAQTSITHTLVAASQSLSLDEYYNDIVGAKFEPDSESFESEMQVSNLLMNLFGKIVKSGNANYSLQNKWYESDLGGNTSNEAMQDAIRRRFIAYLTTKGEEDADRYLRSLRVDQGLDGIDFSDSYIQDGNLYIIAKYKLNYLIELKGVSKAIDVEQSVCAKLWKDG